MTRDEVLAVLKGIVNPATGTDLIASDTVRALTVEGGKIRFVLEVAPDQGSAMAPVRQAAQAALEQIAGEGNVTVLLTAHSTPKPPDLKAAGRPAQGPQKPDGVGAVIAIASGKGGVGKSTVAANLAVALVAEGKRVGLLDADVYGPSQPRMLGVTGRPASPDGKTILPLRNHGVTLMSIGLMTQEEEAVIWRGPMLIGALQQMLTQVKWGQLDVLLVDLPPGTGDVQLTLTQKTELAGAVVVSTPQDIALLDVRKALNMFEKTGTPVLGMIENMSTFICPHCGGETQLFGHGGARENAERLGIPFLGEIPLDLEIRKAGDGGAPIVVSKADSPEALAFRAIARGLIDEGRV
ncbi:Scaffold protein for [4Fe-4S] cluster assembly ApbC, MRP-like [Rhodovulum sp. P5]|nr:Scaffold protein for [4Fe-4S] cluster assembly ApbC, MRP-like [Rhodovulum sp. P5]